MTEIIAGYRSKRGQFTSHRQRLTIGSIILAIRRRRRQRPASNRSDLRPLLKRGLSPKPSTTSPTPAAGAAHGVERALEVGSTSPCFKLMTRSRWECRLAWDRSRLSRNFVTTSRSQSYLPAALVAATAGAARLRRSRARYTAPETTIPNSQLRSAPPNSPVEIGP